MQKVVSVSDLRQNAAKLLGEVQGNHDPCLILSRSRPVAVLMSATAFEEMQERLRRLEEAELLRVVEEGEAEFRAGKARRLRSLKDLR
ncbi:MAG: type II toxin-antitoxin system Phd/YefM family antitoxin [Acidobacteria bacterium]|jgi:prevent-host-death family protein|nr:type II toxin-antitoxin system Phd/YefM family antitoxin [Acidobacteriota bacterium]